VYRRITAGFVALALLLPVLALPAMKTEAQILQKVPGKGMSTKTKLVVLAGAALLYYLYRKHQATVAARQPVQGQGNTAVAARQPQLYRSKNGGIYYRDAQGKPVWLTAPAQSIQVPASDVQRYAPDYNQYRGPAPAVPAGYRTQSFSQFDPNALPAPAPASARGSGMAPGPRR